MKDFELLRKFSYFVSVVNNCVPNLAFVLLVVISLGIASSALVCAITMWIKICLDVACSKLNDKLPFKRFLDFKKYLDPLEKEFS